MSSITILPLDKWLVPQLQEILQMKMNKGDIQAEFDLKDSAQSKSIRVNLKQLFIVIQALIRVSGSISLEEICYTDSKEDNPLTRQLFILRDGSRIKDLTYMGATHEDVLARDQARLVEHNWNKDQ